MPDEPIDVSGLGACPIPISDYPRIVLAHGGGGTLSRMLADDMFRAAFDNPLLDPLHDGAVLAAGGTRFAFTTDAFVVSPLFFPGGDIGSLAVHGTINDLAMCGARPLALAAAFVIEEGFAMEDLWRITRSMRTAADEAGRVPIATGDTKVVDHGKGDGVYITTTGIGIIPPGISSDPQDIRPGDRVLINGTIADHGIAIMSVREGLEFDTAVVSDSAPLHDLVATMTEAGGAGIRVMRDPTRGGVASALNELVAGGGSGIRLEEQAIPVRPEVQAACEILGFDPLYVANEGKVIAIVAPEAADDVLEAMRGHPLGRDAADIGEAVADRPGRVVLRSRVGGMRIVDMLSGEQLPRIC
jgi:hydrogenase expression/formation protein HypE